MRDAGRRVRWQVEGLPAHYYERWENGMLHHAIYMDSGKCLEKTDPPISTPNLPKRNTDNNEREAEL